MTTLLVLLFLLGIINVFTTTPMWVVNMRLKLQGKANRGNNNLEDEEHRPPHYLGMIGEIPNYLHATCDT